MTIDEEDRQREIVETRADIDAKRWQALYPHGWRTPPHDGVVRRMFTVAHRMGHLGEARIDAYTYEIYRVAFLRGAAREPGS
jgi:hypothetical protein